MAASVEVFDGCSVMIREIKPSSWHLDTL